jgi:hypothetical protein
MNKKIFMLLIRQLRDIRRCPVELIMFYRTKFEGYCEALLDLDVIDFETYKRLTCDLGMKASFPLSRRRILKRDESPVVSSSVEVVQDDSPAEKISTSAASFRLSLCGLYYRSFYTHVEQLNPRTWCPYKVWLGLYALRSVPAGWPPLSGKRSLVGGQGQVRVSSGQASS